MHAFRIELLLHSAELLFVIVSINNYLHAIAGCALMDSREAYCITRIPSLPTADLACTSESVGERSCPPACRTSILTRVYCHACTSIIVIVIDRLS